MNIRLKKVIVALCVLTALYLGVIWLSFAGTTAWISSVVVISVAAIIGVIAYRGTEPWYPREGTWFEEDEEEK